MSSKKWIVGEWEIQMFDETDYWSDSVDNVRFYDREIRFQDADFHFSNRYGIKIFRGSDLLTTAVLMAGGGPLTVHQDSLAFSGTTCFVAVGNRLVALCLPALDFEWSLEVDWATCFGIHYHEASDSLLVHGELEISRVSLDGEKLWLFSGRDIFTGGFSFSPNEIVAVDFESYCYTISIETGKLKRLKTGNRERLR